jgi:hypothetical protein
MKSHSCKKTRGAGVPTTSSLTSAPGAAPPDPVADLAPFTALPSAELQPQIQQDEAALCRHIDAQGRRCRMLVMGIEADLCAYHAQRRLQTQRGNETAAAELLSSVSDFSDAGSVNRFLGNLVKQVTLKRIPRRDAITLAYICQLLLNSLGALNREESLRLEQARVQALAAAKRPPRIIWDIPGPPYEPPDPNETR